MPDSSAEARGAFVVIEGLDGAGTTTQCDLLAEHLRAAGQPTVVTREPSDGPVGALIRQMLSKRVVTPDPDGGHRAVSDDVLALLFAADRLDHIDTEIDPHRADGRVVVSDRYYHSSMAYQGHQEDDGHFDISWVRQLNKRARRPDLTLFLEASTDTCLERMRDRGRRDIYENRDKLRSLEARYASVVSTLVEEGEPIVTIDAEASIDDVHERVVSEVTRRLGL